MTEQDKTFLTLAHEHYWHCYQQRKMEEANKILNILGEFCCIYGITQEEADHIKLSIGKKVLKD